MDQPQPLPLPVPKLEPSSLVYLTGEDSLRLTAFNSAAGVTLTLKGRFLPAVLYPDGSLPRVQAFRHDLVPATNRTASTRTETLGEGWLLDAHVVVSAGSSSHGQCYAFVSIVRGKTGAIEELSTISSGYVTANQRLPVVMNSFAGMGDGAGALRSITGATPAAGANISEAVPTGARWELLGFRYQLVTSAVVGTRIVSLLFDDGVNNPFNCSGPPQTQAASQTFIYFHGQAQVSVSAATNANQSALPVDNRLAAGFRIRTQTAAIDVGDQFSGVQYLVREWIEVN